MTQIAIQFSMIVEITSCTPTVAFRKPAIAAHTAPARAASTTARKMWTPEAMFTQDDPTQTLTNAPTRYWPWPPMLKRPHLKANDTANPVRISAVVSSSVCWRLNAASVRESPVTHGKSQSRPVPSNIPLRALNGLCPVAAMTTIATANAKRVVTTGMTIPPARWSTAIRAATLGA